MVLKNWRALGSLCAVAALSLAVLVLAACGSAAEPEQQAPTATDQPATAPAATPGDEPASAASDEAEPQGEVAPKFTLPSATGESVSLASFAGDKNVVLVFYRGFW